MHLKISLNPSTLIMRTNTVNHVNTRVPHVLKETVTVVAAVVQGLSTSKSRRKTWSSINQ